MMLILLLSFLSFDFILQIVNSLPVYSIDQKFRKYSLTVMRLVDHTYNDLSTEIFGSIKLKVLCLHGYLSSGKDFRLKIRNIVSKSSEIADFTFLSAPNSDEIIKSSGRTWWKASPDLQSRSIKYDGIDSSLSLIASAEIEKGPFDIIFGHSQGGSFCHALNMIQSNKIYFNSYFGHINLELLPLPSMSIVLNGFVPGDQVFNNYWTQHREIKSDSISVHVISKTDTIVPPFASKEAISLYSNSHLIEYEGSHFPPYDDNVENQIVDYIRLMYKKKLITINK